MSNENERALTLQELPELRRKTETVSRFLQAQLAAHLETLRPLFAPERILGKYAGGKVDPPGTERALAELQEKYRAFTHKPYDLPETFDANWLTLVGSALELQPWEYSHSVQGRPITMTSPVRWVAHFRGNCTLAQAKSGLAGRDSVRPDFLRQFVVNALVLQLLLNRNPGLVQLFQDLRYELRTEQPADLSGLPVVTITSCLVSFRPADDLIQAATAFSGVPAFIELINLEAAHAPKDALKEQLGKMLGN